MRRFNNWSDELRYRVERIGNDGAGNDEKHAGGVYDMATDIAIAIEGIVERQFDDNKIDEVIECIYNAIKYGDNIN